MKDLAIVSAIDMVRADLLREEIERLVRHNRHRDEPAIGCVASHISDRFVANGIERGCVRIDAFPFTSHQTNVFCLPRQFERPVILIGAHYDSALAEPGTGADDNASGIAALLELVRLLSKIELTHDLVYAAFGAEESDLNGSRYLAAVAVGQRWPIALMINLDMIGAPAVTDRNRVIVECDARSHATPHNDAASKAFGALTMQMAATYTSLRPDPGDIRASDHMSFEEMGFACIGVYEGDGNPHRHQSTDCIETIDFGYLRQVVQMVLATVLAIAK